jgi:chorismate dehydratase
MYISDCEDPCIRKSPHQRKKARPGRSALTSRETRKTREAEDLEKNGGTSVCLFFDIHVYRVYNSENPDEQERVALTKAHVRIGRIRYANLFPIFYMLERSADRSAYEFIDGVPSVVNRLLREGDLAISPSSSIEYLRSREKYTVLDGHSISSAGPIGSILLFSRRPIETLDGQVVLASSQSETSVALLGIILRKFYDLDCPLRSTSEPLEKVIGQHTACLLIGDDALREAPGWPKLHIYDLGEIWYKNTGLPFVFALWIARNDWSREEPALFERFRKALDAAKTHALKDLRTIAGESSLRDILSVDEIVSYWKGISYDLGEEHKKGLELFRKYAEEVKLLT